MKVLILTANLGDFDKSIVPVKQNRSAEIDFIDFFEFNFGNFPPITGLTPRLQYRIPKMFGWQMEKAILIRPDVVIWHDSSMSLQHPDSTKWLVEQLGDADIAVFKHPWRSSIREEVDHIDKKLIEGNKYITSRYKNGLHKEMLKEIYEEDKNYRDDWLFASNVFIYKNNPMVIKMMIEWWFYQSRYFTCDQVHLPYVLNKSGLDVNVINENVFKSEYITLTSKHK